MVLAILGLVAVCLVTALGHSEAANAIALITVGGSGASAAKSFADKPRE